MLGLPAGLVERAWSVKTGWRRGCSEKVSTVCSTSPHAVNPDLGLLGAWRINLALTTEDGGGTNEVSCQHDTRSKPLGAGLSGDLLLINNKNM